MHRLIYILLLLSATFARAQQFGTEWMTSPSPSDASCQWFRRTFVSPAADARPLRASVCVATNSRFILYVNGRNVSTSLYMPNRSQGDRRTIAMTIDVTRFLRPDSNTVAVLACPSAIADPSPASPTYAPPRMSVGFFGLTEGRRPFSYSSVDGWLCHAASTSFTADGELMDGRSDALFPAYGDMVVAQWKPAVAVPVPNEAAPVDLGVSAESIFGYTPRGCNILADNNVYVHSTLSPCYFDIDGNAVTYDFSPGFYGMARVTLRGCRRGERIRIGANLTYICSGDIDEQAFCRFSPQYARKITISGDSWFRPEQVQSVEALGI